MKLYNVIGLMSGTSLDGLDIAYCTFQFNEGNWEYSIKASETVRYSKEWYLKLKEVPLYSSEKLLQTHNEYGVFLGSKVLGFNKKHNLKNLELVSSHGHTVFHNPEKGFTFQLGNGASLATVCGITTVCDFRMIDVALHGQGAPLVPIGDRLLFGGYDFCLNLGGFSNISFEANNNRIAFDICPVNTALNYLSLSKGKKFDKGGIMAQSGIINKKLLEELNSLEYYKKKKPKSLGREWLLKYFLPLIDSYSISVEDKLATVTEHIALQISKVVLKSGMKGKILITGGGANNKFLILKLRKKLPSCQIIIPSQNLVNYKEALIFAFLGVLKMKNKINTLKSVTGAIKDSTGGVLFTP